MSALASMNSILKKLLARENLSQTEAATALAFMISEEATDAQISALLIALAAKGETAEELAGFASTMRERSAKISSAKFAHCIDTCGTGGSPVKTFNVSTAVAFVVAAAGVPVAKHGNVGVTTKIGSADVLKALGAETNVSLELVQRCLDEINMCFMFAPAHHSATKRVAMIRRELGIRTIFNWLGPLTNPANAPHQIIGVPAPDFCERQAQALHLLGTVSSWVVSGDDKLDEITLAAETVVVEATASGIRKFKIAPEDFGIKRNSLENLHGESAQENAEIITAVLRGERTDAALDLVTINAAAALHVAGKGETLSASTALARQTISDGHAWAKLEAFRNFSHL